MSHKGFTIDELTKLEGHAKLNVEMEGGKVTRTNLEVYEASRYFEAMVLGRDCMEAPTIMQRICGICSVVHTLTSIKAVEDALSVHPSGQTVDLRKLLLYASTIHSHTAHLFFFALPDYLGFEDAIEMSKKKHDYIHLAFDLQKLSSDIVRLIGGRALHPVTPTIGGFHSVPDRRKIESIRKNFGEIKRLSEKAAGIFTGLELPELEGNPIRFSLKKAREYPLYDGIIADNAGFSFKPKQYKRHFAEEISPYSNAKHAKFRGKSYMTGALPRLNANHKYLSGSARALLKEAGMKPPISNPFANNLAQAIETVHFADEALNILDGYKGGMNKESFAVKPREGEGIGICEAPRGLLFHHYKIGRDGKIRYANVITPTSQNVASMENDVSLLVPKIAEEPEKKARLLLEMLIRAYDPCFSCSSHFLELRINKT